MNRHESDASSHTLTEIPTNRSTNPSRPSHWRLVLSHSLLIEEVVDFPYNGSGSIEDPFVVEYIPNDPRNPMSFTRAKKWFLTVLVAFATLTVGPTDSLFHIKPSLPFLRIEWSSSQHSHLTFPARSLQRSSLDARL